MEITHHSPDQPWTQEDRPEVLTRTAAARFVEWTCRVPELSCWPGHFPGFPVVPGVLQVDWAMEAAGELLGRPALAAEFEGVTFRQTLGPEATFQLRVEFEGGDWMRFRVWGDGGEHARGRVRLLGATVEAQA